MMQILSLQQLDAEDSSFATATSQVSTFTHTHLDIAIPVVNEES
jgi:hypothetical protein